MPSGAAVAGPTPVLRYGVQLATALLVTLVSSLPLYVTNFMNGLDGLVAGCMAVAISALAMALSASWP